jgi:hypothetical protein
VRSSGLLRTTTIGCAALAAAAVVISALAGHLGFGAGVAAGLLLGPVNAYSMQELLVRRTPFRLASLVRLVALSSLVLLAAVIFGTSAWTVPLGIGLGLLVMVAAGVREGLRA